MKNGVSQYCLNQFWYLPIQEEARIDYQNLDYEEHAKYIVEARETEK